MIINPENQEAATEIKAIERMLFSKRSPLKFSPKDPNNTLKLHFKAQQDAVTILEENGVNNAKSLTVFEFRSKVAFYQKRAEDSKNPPIQ